MSRTIEICIGVLVEDDVDDEVIQSLVSSMEDLVWKGNHEIDYSEWEDVTS